MEHDLTSFSRSLEGLWGQMQRHYFTDDLNLAERLLLQVDDHLRVLRAIYGRVMEFSAQLPSADTQSLVNDVEVVYTEMCKYADHYQDRIEEETLNFPVRNPWQCSVELTGQPGRPPFLVPIDYIEALIEFGFTYEQMSAVLGISSRTLRRRRQEHGLPVGRNYTDIPDSELDQEVNSILMVCLHIWTWLFGPGPTLTVVDQSSNGLISIHPLWMSINYVRGYCFRNSDVCV